MIQQQLQKEREEAEQRRLEMMQKEMKLRENDNLMHMLRKTES